MTYTMMQVCKETGLSYQTLKFYCNEGLVPHVERDKNNRRIFSEAMVRWIKDLSCLKKCNMSIQEMKEYLRLCLEGPSSISVRQTMLAHKKELLTKQIEELEASLAYIDWKQNFYEDVLSGKRPYISNLLPSQPGEEESSDTKERFTASRTR
ncbi:MerR family transcriptional regulator [Veillonella magna]|uniref:MerR family transcriptional regulator n=1 Tax=Veillonella magna TaxID=464322 RepID=A0ABS2GFU8_9FIRM|nr:MerR family transcriptional regulator [Veillonella magna]MBM6824755.1 MerR family transcriptional regulator [Veillonella magna]MBM6913049.1 MerR family transcriptional regulator [Veillonella magna]